MWNKPGSSRSHPASLYSSSNPLLVEYRGFFVGKFVEVVMPVRKALPALSSTMREASSLPLPPRYVENSRLEPSGVSFVTNASYVPPAKLVWKALVTGKFNELVKPLMIAWPCPSTAMPCARSSPLPPRYVEYVKFARPGANLMKNASRAPPRDG